MLGQAVARPALPCRGARKCIVQSLLGAALLLAALDKPSWSMVTTPAQLRPRETPPLLDVPVYSLATLNEDGSTNMNILTYASPVGIRPQRVWAISLYRKTRTHANFVARGSGVLQLLRRRHSGLVYVLGGQSGNDIDKAARCDELGFPWQKSEEMPLEELLLPGAVAYLQLKQVGDLVNAGDHDIAMCSISGMYEEAMELEDQEDTAMNSGFLRAKGLINERGQAVEPA
eukprot:TRINITY_DN42475_c0_g1_i1.p1 TRINITY_DN42475_c0_g1~~TRINITY_DN42475_c0_g1_i1.p1  ORF type:complete len:261 (-),score=51.67 TRINITY_DN42475_c0_g1_i1:605-1294(-)